MKRKPLLVVGSLLGLALLLTVCGQPIALFMGGFMSGLAGTPSASEVRAEAQPTATSRLRATPLPPTLRGALDTTLGASNRTDGRKLKSVVVREDEGSISVTWAIDDNLGSLIMVGAEQDVYDILRAIEAGDVAYEHVFLAGTFAMQDRYGNAAEEEALIASFSAGELGRVNWDNLSPLRVLELADSSWVAPGLE